MVLLMHVCARHVLSRRAMSELDSSVDLELLKAFSGQVDAAGATDDAAEGAKGIIAALLAQTDVYLDLVRRRPPCPPCAVPQPASICAGLRVCCWVSGFVRGCPTPVADRVLLAVMGGLQ